MSVLNSVSPPVSADLATVVRVLRGFGPARVPDMLRRCQLADRQLLPALDAGLAAGRIVRDGDRYRVAEVPDPTPAQLATELFNPHARLNDRAAQWLRRLHELAADRPSEHDEWHQRRVTLRSSLLRPLYLHYRGDVADRDVTLIGDNDLTSVAMFLVGGFRSIRVLEADPSVVEFLVKTFDQLDAGKTQIQAQVKVQIREFDARQPLPNDLYDSADVVMCDPSRRLYRSFFARADELLRDDGVFYTFVNPSHSPATGQFIFQRDAIAAGWILTDSIPVINESPVRAGRVAPQHQAHYPDPGDHDDAISFTESLVRFVRGPGLDAEDEIRRTVHDRAD
ncbi:bis-aminopropyl spermidine synthase family protein [Mycobacterium haemophilum]|uniref:bis-aminopropyl spermidine synthase family protein n=1 Tax=Mycobacterium haemophilum TaxID=29311 RepID=UPI000B12EB88|nr:bis-aminopropyl spermidine synthase family protein [Mycobacterium haemophilum]MCV7341795.1 bis-aminopropyl spermidine synthase family protein [Mycobacterium haemophilum DSM 44634]